MSANRLTAPRQTMNLIAALRSSALTPAMDAISAESQGFEDAHDAKEDQQPDTAVTDDFRRESLLDPVPRAGADGRGERALGNHRRSEEHTSELQSLAYLV